MLIIVPSFRRTECLYWVLKSISRCDVSTIAEPKRVVVVNNHPPSRQAVESIVEKFRDKTAFEWHTLHRQETLPPIDSWYSAMAQFAAEGEVVMLLGDDDLMLPWGITDRYREIVNSRADMILSDYAGRIFFFHGSREYWMTGPLPLEVNQERRWRQWEFFPAPHPEPSFVSNHGYRNTVAFRRGLDLALTWCDSQGWLERKVRTGMLPFYLPYAITLSGGNVVSLHSKCVLRGACAEESMRSTFADGGNEAFYNLCAYDVLSNRALPRHTEQLARAGARFSRAIARGYFSMLCDRNVSWEALTKTIRHAGLGWRNLASTESFYGVLLVLIRLMGLRGIRLRLVGRSKSLSTTESMFQ